MADLLVNTGAALSLLWVKRRTEVVASAEAGVVVVPALRKVRPGLAPGTRPAAPNQSRGTPMVIAGRSVDAVAWQEVASGRSTRSTIGRFEFVKLGVAPCGAAPYARLWSRSSRNAANGRRRPATRWLAALLAACSANLARWCLSEPAFSALRGLPRRRHSDSRGQQTEHKNQQECEQAREMLCRSLSTDPGARSPRAAARTHGRGADRS